MHAVMRFATKIVRKAGAQLVQGYDDIFRVAPDPGARMAYIKNLKRGVVEHFNDALRRAYPGNECVVGEVRSLGDDYTWCVDVLVGEENFSFGVPHFAFVVAIINDGDVKCSLVFDPLRDELFSAIKGVSTQLNMQRLRLKSDGVSSSKLIAVTDMSEGAGLQNDKWSLRLTGCAALDMAYVSAGRYHGFWGHGASAVSMAAGGLLVQEAGGLVTTLDGRLPWESGHIIAGGGKFFTQLASKVQAG